MKKKTLTTVLLIVVFLAGLSLVLYPTIANYWNSIHQTRAIATYVEQVADRSKEENAAQIERAHEFNARIPQRRSTFALSQKDAEEYESLLNIGGNGVMGYVEIPSIEVALPIYHGTDDAVLQVAVGHLDWTSLPVGGLGTHAVLSSHRGLPSARLFTDLDELIVGDVFVLRILDEVLTYEVDQILIVLPEETDDLLPVPGKDYCTLVTCTPYGINTHRLLVRGHRVENVEEAIAARVTADAIQVEEMIVAPIIALPLLAIFLIVLFVNPGKKKRNKQSDS